MPQTIHCPTCRAAVAWESQSKWRPFCSQRCKLIDLGAWFNEENTIPGVQLPEDLLDEIAYNDNAANEDNTY